MIVMGGSLGGMKEAKIVLRSLPKSLAMPILLVLHRQKQSDNDAEGLLNVLQTHSPLPILEALDKEPIKPGVVYLAPADYHMLVEAEGAHLSLTIDPPVNFARPSIDVLFESVAENVRSPIVAIVLSGANRDGARGSAIIESRGGKIIVTDPAKAECAVMPLAAVHGTKKPYVRTVDQIAPLLVEWAGEMCGKEI